MRLGRSEVSSCISAQVGMRSHNAVLSFPNTRPDPGRTPQSGGIERALSFAHAVTCRAPAQSPRACVSARGAALECIDDERACRFVLAMIMARPGIEPGLADSSPGRTHGRARDQLMIHTLT